MHDAKDSIGTDLVPGSLLMSGVDRRTYPLDFWARSSQTYDDDSMFRFNDQCRSAVVHQVRDMMYTCNCLNHQSESQIQKIVVRGAYYPTHGKLVVFR